MGSWFNPWFWSEKWPFFQFFFLGNIAEENVFYVILERKILFYALKTRILKSRKIDINIFPKGLTDCFGPKMAIFPSFFFRQYRPGKCLLRFSRTKRRLSTL